MHVMACFHEQSPIGQHGSRSCVSPWWLVQCGSWQPVDIVPEEEAERLRGLELRENLVRGMGVAELLYFLLQNRAQGQDTHPWQATALQQYHHQCIDKDKVAAVRLSATTSFVIEQVNWSFHECDANCTLL